MKLYLVQHGNANPEEVDPEKNLSDQGKDDVAKVAKFLQGAGVKVKDIFHSGKARAQQSADILNAAISIEAPPALKKDGLEPMDDVGPIAAEIEERGEDLMLVGHMPFINRLASKLLAGDAEADLIQFQQGGILTLEKSEGKWRVAGMIVPEML